MKKALFAAVALAAASISGAASAGEVFVAALKHDVTFIGDTLGSAPPVEKVGWTCNSACAASVSTP